MNSIVAKKEKKIDIPKGFIKKIKKLGMNVDDAEILYKTQVDWTAVYSNNKIYCTEPGCDYCTEIDNGNLKMHLMSAHNYGDFPCPDPQCNFIGVSQKNLNLHNRMHTRLSVKQYWYKCPKSNCQTSFESESRLHYHIRIHNNDFYQCQYCQFKYLWNQEYETHLRQHFKIDTIKCDQCDKSFGSSGALKIHYRKHEGISYSCLLCDGYQASHKQTMADHLKSKHGEIVGKHIIWDSVQKFIKTIK